MISIAWNSPQWVGEGQGPNAQGYHVHDASMKAAVARIAEVNGHARDTVSICPAELFVPIPGRRNWLFTTFEGLDLPGLYVKQCKKADCLIVPSTVTALVFASHLPQMPVYVVPEGVSHAFSYHERYIPEDGRPFRFLWVGSPNKRKGWEEIRFAWDALKWRGRVDVELYMKTTAGKEGGGVQHVDNIIIDYRNVPQDELVALYHSAHCFLFPTRGESFGLTLAEAMGTGIPCIATGAGGHMEFFDGTVGYPTEFFRAVAEFSSPCEDGHVGIVKSRVYMAEMGSLCNQMVYVPTHYEEASDKGKLASERIHTEFTWDRAARELLRIIEGEQHGPNH